MYIYLLQLQQLFEKWKIRFKTLILSTISNLSPSKGLLKKNNFTIHPALCGAVDSLEIYKISAFSSCYELYTGFGTRVASGKGGSWND